MRRKVFQVSMMQIVLEILSAAFSKNAAESISLLRRLLLLLLQEQCDDTFFVGLHLINFMISFQFLVSFGKLTVEDFHSRRTNDVMSHPNYYPCKSFSRLRLLHAFSRSIFAVSRAKGNDTRRPQGGFWSNTFKWLDLLVLSTSVTVRVAITVSSLFMIWY